MCFCRIYFNLWSLSPSPSPSSPHMYVGAFFLSSYIHLVVGYFINGCMIANVLNCLLKVCVLLPALWLPKCWKKKGKHTHILHAMQQMLVGHSGCTQFCHICISIIARLFLKKHFFWKIQYFGNKIQNIPMCGLAVRIWSICGYSLFLSFYLHLKNIFFWKIKYFGTEIQNIPMRCFSCRIWSICGYTLFLSFYLNYKIWSSRVPRNICWQFPFCFSYIVNR